MPILCALVGATGVGKTKLSLMLSREFHAEIISMDSRQIYRGFRIGTAQPSAEELRLAVHHLVNFFSPTQNFSAGEFVCRVKKLLNENPKTPYILVGGTGMYLQALTEGLAEIPQVDEDVRKECENYLLNNGVNALYERVKKWDAETAACVSPQDQQRLLRALEVYVQTGRKFSEIRRERRGGVGTVKTFWLDRLRTTLYERIDQRVLNMIENGWKEEVVYLLETVPLSAPAWQSLGYKEWVECIQGRLSERELVEIVQKGSRHYAKRQITWFRNQTRAEKVDLDAELESSFQKIAQKIADR